MDLLEIFTDSNELIRYPAGTVIITEGQEGSHMYVVIEGEADISLKGTVIAKARRGDIVGEMALINSDLRSASVTATSDCTVAVIDQASFQSMLRHVPDFSMHVMNVLADRLKLAYEMIAE